MMLFRILTIAIIAMTATACAHRSVRQQATPPAFENQEPPRPSVREPDGLPPPASDRLAQGQEPVADAPADSDASVDARPLVEMPDYAGRASPLETDKAATTELDAVVIAGDAPVRDPWEGFNRKVYAVNNVVDKYAMRPIAVGYDKIMPDAAQAGVSRFFGNLRTPATAVNQTLQGHPLQGLQSLGRFVVNTSIGIGGLFDPASGLGIPKRDDEDFGQTLATWGWKDSRYLVVPLMGPRTVRDTVGMVGDKPLSPIGSIGGAAAIGLQALQMADARARALPMDEARRTAFDEYALVRDTWSQRRRHQIEHPDPDDAD